jgi:hypothetical protein
MHPRPGSCRTVNVIARVRPILTPPGSRESGQHQLVMGFVFEPQHDALVFDRRLDHPPLGGPQPREALRFGENQPRPQVGGEVAGTLATTSGVSVTGPSHTGSDYSRNRRRTPAPRRVSRTSLPQRTCRVRRSASIIEARNGPHVLVIRVTQYARAGGTGPALGRWCA